MLKCILIATIISYGYSTILYAIGYFCWFQLDHWYKNKLDSIILWIWLLSGIAASYFGTQHVFN